MSYGMNSAPRGAAGSAQMGNSAGMKEKIPSGYKKFNVQQYNPMQQGLHEQLFQHVSPDSYLSRLAGGDQSAFEESEAPAWKLFQEQLGQLGSRFSEFSPGAMGSRRGSGFKNAAGQLGSDFAMQLSSRRQDLRRQALQDLMGISHELLGQRPFETGLVQKQKPWWQELLTGSAQGLAQGGAQAATAALFA